MQVYKYLFLFVLFCHSCSLFEIQGPEPAFIVIDELEFVANADQGPPTHTIQYVEVFFENRSLGIYQVPLKLAVIPTQAESTLVIKPAINENGIKFAITPYVMMQSYELTQNFATYETYTIKPVFRYLSNVEFAVAETFEGPHVFNLDLDEIDSTFLVLTNETAASGINSGLMEVENDQVIEIGNDFKTSNLIDGGAAFLELEYKNNIPFIVGLIGYDGNFEAQTALISFIPKEDWNKTYIDLTPILIGADLSEYRIFFKVEARGFSGKVYIDNVKMLYKK